MATKIIKICDICNSEYGERECNKIPFGDVLGKAEYLHQYNSELRFQYCTDDPILGDNTVKMFTYDLCPGCAQKITHQLKILP